MTIIQLIFFLIKTLAIHGNLKIRIFAENQDFVMRKDFLVVDFWEGRKELHIE